MYMYVFPPHLWQQAISLLLCTSFALWRFLPSSALHRKRLTWQQHPWNRSFHIVDDVKAVMENCDGFFISWDGSLWWGKVEIGIGKAGSSASCNFYLAGCLARSITDVLSRWSHKHWHKEAKLTFSSFLKAQTSIFKTEHNISVLLPQVHNQNVFHPKLHIDKGINWFDTGLLRRYLRFPVILEGFPLYLSHLHFVSAQGRMLLLI